MLEGQGTHAHFILISHECIWNAPWVILHLGGLEYTCNAPVVSLVLPAFDNTSSLGSPLHQVVYPPGSMVPPWVTAFHFLAENREAELKPSTSSLLLLFCVFLYFLFS